MAKVEMIQDRITVLTADGKDHTARFKRLSNSFDGGALDKLVEEFVTDSGYTEDDVTGYYLFSESVVQGTVDEFTEPEPDINDESVSVVPFKVKAGVNDG